MSKIPVETLERAKRMYKSKKYTLTEISNLLNISVNSILKSVIEAIKQGELKAKSPCACKPRTPNGQGKQWVQCKGVGKGGRNKERKKFTPEQELEIAKQYFENGLTAKQVMAQYGVHPEQMQHIRKTYGQQFASKQKGRPRKSFKIAQYSLNGQLIAVYDNYDDASLFTGINQRTIMSNCYGLSKKCKGYVFKHIEKTD